MLKTTYDIVINDDNGFVSIDLAGFHAAGEIVPSDVDGREGWFFNVTTGGSSLSVWSESISDLEKRRKNLLKARDKFMAKYYKQQATTSAKAVNKTQKKITKRYKKNFKKELSVLKKIAKRVK